ncbi:ABC transporter ATP-binding protein [Enterocloster citroniae]|nr:ABC transporter ATP-binding protein [Enterocloster citroniae]
MLTEKKQNWLSGIFGFIGEYKGAMIGSVTLAVLSVACGLIPYFAVSRIIILFLQNEAEMGRIAGMAAIALGGYALHRLLFSTATVLSHQTAFAVLKNIRSAIAEKLICMPMGTVMGRSSGQYKDILVDEVERVEFPIAHMLPEFTSNLLIPVAVLIYMLTLDPRLALCSVTTVVLGLLCFKRMMSNYEVRFSKYMEACETLNSTVIEYVNGIEVIKAFGQSTSSYEKYADAVNGYRDYTLEWYKRSWMFSSAAYSIMPSVLLTVLPAGAVFYRNGTLELPVYIVCIILSLGLVPPLIKVVEFLDNFAVMEQTEAMVQGLLSAEELSRPKRAGQPDGYSFEFKNVGFAYDKAQVLQDVSFTAKEGQMTALAGPSGSGKSTIAKLMVRFWDSGSGEILLGGTNIRDIPQDILMDHISYVSQDNYLFNISILENIRIGRPGATVQEVKEAAKKACCHEFIEKLEHGYDTLAGDAGGQLSGGERQRIAIARAILKNAPVVILDEATAFTDPENEDKIQSSISSLTRGKTLIVIAHRLSTIVNADQILVVDSGRIEASGTHKKLMEECPLYQRLWRSHMDSMRWGMGSRKEEYDPDHKASFKTGR